MHETMNEAMHQTMHQEDYRVHLDAFHGPLDLLLYLIRRAELDIVDIPLAQLTDQYVEFLRQQPDEIDVDLAGEFTVMAASLVEMKSRTLVPPETDGEDAVAEAENGTGLDPRHELVQQLLAYQRFRLASEGLAEKRRRFEAQWPLRPMRISQEVDESVELELEDVHVMDLAETYERIMSSINFDLLGDHVVEFDDTPIALYQEDLVDRLRRRPEHTMTLQDAFDGSTPLQRVGLFLATLELARTRRVEVEQDELDGDIEMHLIGDGEGEPMSGGGA